MLKQHKNETVSRHRTEGSLFISACVTQLSLFDSSSLDTDVLIGWFLKFELENLSYWPDFVCQSCIHKSTYCICSPSTLVSSALLWSLCKARKETTARSIMVYLFVIGNVWVMMSVTRAVTYQESRHESWQRETGGTEQFTCTHHFDEHFAVL